MQDEALNIKCYATETVKTIGDSKCTMYQQFDDTAEHLTVKCTSLPEEESDRVFTQLHLITVSSSGSGREQMVQMKDISKRVGTIQDKLVAILWDQHIKIDRTIPCTNHYDTEKGRVY